MLPIFDLVRHKRDLLLNIYFAAFKNYKQVPKIFISFEFSIIQ